MKSSCVLLALLLALNIASRLSLAGATDAHDHEGASASIPAIFGRELRGFIARAGNIFRPAEAWRAANATAAAEAKNLRAVASSRRRRPTRKSSGGGGSGAGCVSAATCRKRRVICAKRCYAGSRAAAATASSLINHVPSRCVVRCKKCVPTC
ncbi:hypothetical protein BS78_06G167000 [Paspalum vaginatum]|nr:hypothetical protein BS78_06G167000 [Paspalum vaginatum]